MKKPLQRIARKRGGRGRVRPPRKSPAKGKAESSWKAWKAEKERLLHDLRVHKIELEMRNQKLVEAQQQLEISRDRYAALYDLAPVPYLTLDSQGRMRELNQATAALLGRSRSRLVGGALALFLKRGDHQLLTGHLRRLAKAEGPVSTELTLGRGRRASIPVVLQSVAGLDVPSKRRVYFTIITDLRQGKEAENRILMLNSELEQRVEQRTLELDRLNDRLLRSNERFELAVRGSNDGIWDWNLLTNEDYFSDRWCELLGYSRSELPPKLDTWSALVHPSDREPIARQVQAHLQEGAPYDAEVRLLTKSGVYRWFRTRGQAVRDGQGRAVRMLGSISDITEQKQTTLLLQGQKQLLELIATGGAFREVVTRLIRFIQAMTEGVICSLLMVDERGERLFHGVAPDLPPDYWQAVEGLRIGPAAGSCGTAAFRREPVFVEDAAVDPLWRDFRGLSTKHGVRACWSTPIFLSDTRLGGVFAMYHHEPGRPGPFELRLLELAKQIVGIALQRDQAERSLVTHQEQLRVLAAKLLVSEEQERRRIAGEIHDQIGQMLAACKLMLGELDTASRSKRLKGLVKGLRSLVEQTIAQSRSLTFELSPPVLYELGLEAALQWLAEQAQKQHGFQVSYVDDQAPKPLAEEVRVLLFRIVRELLFNVGKHARAGSARVEIGRHGSDIRILVQDDGVGFDPGTRLAVASASTGFGLYSIRDRLRHLGGRLEVDSAPGRGTRVIVRVAALPQPGTETT